MTSTLAVIGKSGSGKTTIVKAISSVIKNKFKDSSILLVDNDLTCSLSQRFGLDIRSTIYGIRSGKHEYKTGIPKGMTKQEYIEWALEDILVQIDDNIDIIVSWLVPSKDCRCPITKQMNDALLKLILRYDFVIFDSEFDLKYLNQLVDVDIDSALCVTNDDSESLFLANNIYEFSKKYVNGGQFSIVLNKTNEENTEKALLSLNSNGLNVLGIIKNYNHDDKFEKNIETEVNNFYTRLNLPQNEV